MIKTIAKEEKELYIILSHEFINKQKKIKIGSPHHLGPINV